MTLIFFLLALQLNGRQLVAELRRSDNSITKDEICNAIFENPSDVTLRLYLCVALAKSHEDIALRRQLSIIKNLGNSRNLMNEISYLDEDGLALLTYLLGETRNDEAIPFLLEQLKKEDGKTMAGFDCSAKASLEKIGDKALTRLIKGMADPRLPAIFRKKYLDAASLFKTNRTAVLLDQFIGDSIVDHDFMAGYDIRTTLGSIGDSILPFLKKKFSELSDSALIPYVTIAGRIENKSVLNEFEKLLQKGQNKTIRQLIMGYVPLMEDSLSYRILIQGLYDIDEEVRITALIGLWLHPSKELIDIFKARVDSESYLVRRAMYVIAEKISDEKAIEFLEYCLLKEDSSYARNRLIEALGQTGVQTCGDMLLQDLAVKSNDMIADSFKYTRNIGSSYAYDSSMDHLQALVRAARSLPERDAAVILEQLLENAKLFLGENVRIAQLVAELIYTMQFIRCRDAFNTLTSVYPDLDIETRYAAASAIAKTGHPLAADFLMEAFNKSNSIFEKKAIIEALAVTCNAQILPFLKGLLVNDTLWETTIKSLTTAGEPSVPILIQEYERLRNLIPENSNHIAQYYGTVFFQEDKSFDCYRKSEVVLKMIKMITAQNPERYHNKITIGAE